MLESKPDLKEQNDSGEEIEIPDKEYRRLRSLMLGQDYEAILTSRLENDNVYRVSSVLTEAFKKRNSEDDSLALEMSPVIESAIDESIKNHPERITNVIFPIIGPAVRKAVTRALADLMQSLNYVLQNSLSVKSLVWRIKAWRLGVSYAKYLLTQSIHYQVEQVFLIHRESGLLIQSVQAEGVSYQDPDLVSSMLSAISDFAKDSFEQEEARLETLQMGDLTILIEAGPHAVLALAIRGTLHADVQQVSTELIEALHSNFAKELRYFDGETEPLEPAIPMLQEALITREKAKQESKPWFAIIAVTLLLLVLGYYSYQNYLLQHSIEQTVVRVNHEPGYQVLSRKYEDDLLTLEVLRSAMSVPQNDLIDTLEPSKYEIVFNEKIASIDDPEIYLPYLSSKYQANLSVERGEKNKLIVLGEITEDNLARLRQDSLANSVFSVEKSPKLIIKPSLSIQQKSRSEFVDLVQSINSQLYYFQVASAELTEESQNLLNQNITKIRRILDLQNLAETTIIQIGIFGFADPQGSRTTNIDLSQQRAKLIKSILLENEISDSLVISWGGGAIDMSSVPSQYQRRARIEILYELKGATSHAQ